MDFGFVVCCIEGGIQVGTATYSNHRMTPAGLDSLSRDFGDFSFVQYFTCTYISNALAFGECSIGRLLCTSHPDLGSHTRRHRGARDQLPQDIRSALGQLEHVRVETDHRGPVGNGQETHSSLAATRVDRRLGVNVESGGALVSHMHIFYA